MTDAETSRWFPPSFVGDPFAWKMGVRPLDLADWLIIDRDLDVDRAEKAALLATRHGEVVVAEPGSELAAQSVLALVEEHLAARGIARPGEPHGTKASGATGSRDPSMHPIERAARLVQEDLVVLEHDGDDWRLTSACVCFPTRWHLGSKLGLAMGAIHEPVPRYATDVGPATDRFFDRVRPERPVWRTNWTIDADFANRLEPERSAAIDPTISAANVADRLCLRIEYQTVRKLPGAQAIVFTIRILRYPLRSVVEHDDGVRLLEALDAMPDDVAAYKAGTVRYAPQIRAWLEGRQQTPSSS